MIVGCRLADLFFSWYFLHFGWFASAFVSVYFICLYFMIALSMADKVLSVASNFSVCHNTVVFGVTLNKLSLFNATCKRCLSYFWLILFGIAVCCLMQHKQASRGVYRKRCSENMQQIYWKTPMPKCHFNKVFITRFPKNTSGLRLLLNTSIFTDENSHLNYSVRKGVRP